MRAQGVWFQQKRAWFPHHTPQLLIPAVCAGINSGYQVHFWALWEGPGYEASSTHNHPEVHVPCDLIFCFLLLNLPLTSCEVRGTAIINITNRPEILLGKPFSNKVMFMPTAKSLLTSVRALPYLILLLTIPLAVSIEPRLSLPRRILSGLIPQCFFSNTARYNLG